MASIAVLGGTGNEGGGLALRWGAAGHKVVIGSRDGAKAGGAAQEYSERVPEGSFEGRTNEEAAAMCEIVVLTVPFAGQAALCRSIAGSLARGTIVVDCTVPVAASVGGKPTEVLGVPAGSAAQQAKSLLPEHTIVCSGFHSLSASALYDLAAELEGDVLVCGPGAGKEKVRPLVECIPTLRYVDAGGLSTARIVEPITSLLIGINRRYSTDRSGIRVTGI